jgi:hypothetical protein
MKRAPNWRKEEFVLLARDYSQSDEDLSKRLPNRTIDAIKFVRSGIHQYHDKGKTTLLSKIMKDYLDKPEIPLTCSICGEDI